GSAAPVLEHHRRQRQSPASQDRRGRADAALHHAARHRLHARGTRRLSIDGAPRRLTLMRLPPRTIRARLTLWYTFGLAAPLAAFAVVVYFTFSQALRRRTDAFIN